MRWEVINDRHAILWGPEFWRPIAIITYDPGDLDDRLDDCWRIASPEYKTLNFREEDTTIPVKKIQRRVMIILGQALREERAAIEERLSAAYACMMEVEEK